MVRVMHGHDFKDISEFISCLIVVVDLPKDTLVFMGESFIVGVFMCALRNGLSFITSMNSVAAAANTSALTPSYLGGDLGYSSISQSSGAL